MGLLVFTVSAKAGNDTGLDFTIALDMVSDTKLSENSDAKNKLEAREVEFIAHGPIDHLFDGTMSMAAHPEDGVTLFELHEGFFFYFQINT